MSIKTKLISFTLIHFFALSSFAQDVKWTAQWIMHPTTEPQAASMVLFRESFELQAKPEKFVVHVSADNHYRLFVNGKYVLRGILPVAILRTGFSKPLIWPAIFKPEKIRSLPK